MQNKDVTSLAEVPDNMMNYTDTSPLKENDANAIQKLATANFKTPESQKYFQQEHLLKSEDGIDHGGIRGIVWHARYRNDHYDHKSIMSLDDTKLMMFLTYMLKSLNGSQSEILCCIFDEVLKRTGYSFVGNKVVIPTNRQKSESTFL